MTSPRTHDFTMIAEWSNAFSSTDRFDYCRRCGIVRKSYTHHGTVNSPQFFGIDVEDGTIDVPACVPYVHPRDVTR